MPITNRSLVTPGEHAHLLGVIVEVNPVNAQMVEQMRKWVARVRRARTGHRTGRRALRVPRRPLRSQHRPGRAHPAFPHPVLHALNWPGLGFCRTLKDDEAKIRVCSRSHASGSWGPESPGPTVTRVHVKKSARTGALLGDSVVASMPSGGEGGAGPRCGGRPGDRRRALPRREAPPVAPAHLHAN